MALALGAILCVAFSSGETSQGEPKAPAQGQDLHSEDHLGIRFWKPEKWERIDKSTGPFKILVFSPDNSIVPPRFTVMVFPAASMPNGLLTREVGLESGLGDLYERVRYEDSQVAGRAGKVLEYRTLTAPVSRTLEYGAKVDNRFVMVQTTAFDDKWKVSEETFSRILKSIELFEPQAAPAEPPTKRKEAPELSGNAQVVRHVMHLVVNPEKRELISRGGVRIRAKKAGVDRAEFMISDLSVAGFSDLEGELKFEVDAETDPRKLTVFFRRPMEEGEEQELAYVLHAKDFTFRIEDAPVPNYVVLGQVREYSSFSSHVYYYPVDRDNRAPATISILVPKGYTAVGPGRLLRTEKRERTVNFVWETSFSGPKQLPYGWTVAKYGSLEGKSNSGTPVRIYHLLGSSDHGREILRVAVDVVDFYEATFGAFPFEGISIAQVTPEEGIAGVSLPSLVLLSSLIFEGETSYDKLAKSLESAIGAVLVADEISHQYNFYSVAFPNALAEGLAQYTDTLFAEHVAGIDVLPVHVEQYRQIYLGSISTEADAPIMAEEATESGAYMGIVFSKGAFVVHMLRRLVGDEEFFAGLKKTFTDLRGKKSSLDDFRAAFESVSGKDLKWFFDQWYHRAGYPRLRIEQRFLSDSSELEIEIEQIQEGEPYRLPLVIRLGPGRTEELFVDTRRKTARFKVADDSVRATVDNAADLLAEIEVR
ncbi:MAG: M1 family aminopeptidase [Planctomycetota bacterium]|nr:M1 family aminopeptidase [Planctomycetota bacterium]